jgi:hypothetical protein
MAKMTLLDIVQDIMSDMDSDEINSISDTAESLQVAQIVKTTYYNIIDGKDFPWMYELFQLNTSGTTSRPTHMSLPDDIIDLKWIKYNNKKSTDTKNKLEKVIYKTPEDFINIVDSRDSSSSNISIITDPSDITINVYTDRGPMYFTSFDDETLVFDAYDSAKETNLTNSNTQVYGKRSVTFTLSDSFTPDLPVQMFSYLLNEAKSTAFLTLKQMANQKAEQQSVSQRRRMSQEAWKITNGITYGNYGRK